MESKTCNSGCCFIKTEEYLHRTAKQEKYCSITDNMYQNVQN